jgi:hypothetical protein
MARQFRIVTLVALAVATVTATAQNPTPLARQPGQGSPEFGNVRRALEAMTPEQRQRFIENFKRWANLPPEQRKALADRDAVRRQKIAEEIDKAIAETGLTLEPARRAQFARRYNEERRKIEEQLRKEMEAKRQPLVKEMIGRLKDEFAAKPEAVARP